MRLTKVHVTEFKSVYDSTPFEVGDITCLVGKNEAGKTAVLEALYRLRPIVEEEGLELVEVEFIHHSGSWVLRIYMDKPGGVRVEDCARVSRRLSPVLDVEDLIPHHYTLEVSSPGVPRPIRTARRPDAGFRSFHKEGTRIRMPAPRRRQPRETHLGCACVDPWAAP